MSLDKQHNFVLPHDMCTWRNGRWGRPSQDWADGTTHLTVSIGVAIRGYSYVDLPAASTCLLLMSASFLEKYNFPITFVHANSGIVTTFLNRFLSRHSRTDRWQLGTGNAPRANVSKFLTSTFHASMYARFVLEDEFESSSQVVAFT